MIKQNPKPACFTIAGLGEISVGDVVSGYADTQTDPFNAAFASPGVTADRPVQVDYFNLQGFIQKADSELQFYA